MEPLFSYSGKLKAGVGKLVCLVRQPFIGEDASARVSQLAGECGT